MLQVANKTKKMLNHCLTRLAIGSTTTHLFNSRNMHLLLNKTLVNGDWISANSKKELAVLNPVNGSIVGNVPDMDATDTQNAIDSASKAFYSKEWYGLTAKDRSTLLKVCACDMCMFHLICSNFPLIFCHRNGSTFLK